MEKIKDYWWDFGNKKPSCPPVEVVQTDCGWHPFPPVGNPSVLDIKESECRSIQHPSGSAIQVINSEPLGEPYISLHQNHYAAAQGKPGSHLGSVRFGAKDDLSASISAFADGQWSASSHPTGLAMRVAPVGSSTPRYPSVTLRSDGRVAFGGGPSSLSSSLTSVGIYRPGIMQLPSVDKYDDLSKQEYSSEGTKSEPFVNGAIVYVKEMDKVLISQGGEWHCIVTTPVDLKKDSRLPAAYDTRGFGAMRPPCSSSKRQVGEPRQDGRPVTFGPRDTAAGAVYRA